MVVGGLHPTCSRSLSNRGGIVVRQSFAPETGGIKRIIGAVDFASLVAETHTIDRQGKALCPSHPDRSPSLQVYQDHAYCFACGWHGDALTWLEQARGLSKVDAIKELERRAGVPRMQPTKRISRPQAAVKPCTAQPLSEALHVKLWQRLEQLSEVPKAIQSRGFEVEDCKALGIAASGDNAVLAITDPLGNIVAFKQRYHVVREGQSRYSYLTKNCGTPAWCSPCFWTSQDVLVIEGEINAMSCALVRRNGDKDLAAMGVAGAHGELWLEALKDKDVYVYGDCDKPGQEARDKWALAAYNAGARSVKVLEPWEMDANDVLVKLGADELRERIL
jgi:DNA primase